MRCRCMKKLSGNTEPAVTPRPAGIRHFWRLVLAEQWRAARGQRRSGLGNPNDCWRTRHDMGPRGRQALWQSRWWRWRPNRRAKRTLHRRMRQPGCIIGLRIHDVHDHACAGAELVHVARREQRCGNGCAQRQHKPRQDQAGYQSATAQELHGTIMAFVSLATLMQVKFLLRCMIYWIGP